ncbi:MAG: PAS domain S-box protein [Phycisphaeraceae bacterium]|nr:PAS domain S-box protein [Phycisphaeraceae bacterium]
MPGVLRDHLLLLPAELPWLVRLRWSAGVAVLVAAAGHGVLGDWSSDHTVGVMVGIVVLLYNAAFRSLSRRAPVGIRPGRMLLLAGTTILLDLGMLTALIVVTGGVTSPLLGLFVLHAVIAMLLLPPFIGYGVMGLSVLMMFSGLWSTDQLPTDRTSTLLISGWTATLLLTAFVANHITARLRRQEVHGRIQQARLQAILDTAADGVITIDQRGVIQSANTAAADIFGYAIEEMLGRNVNMLMPEPDHGRHDGYLADYLRTGHAKIIGIGREVYGRRRGGEVFPLELAISEVATDGARGGRMFTGILRDITLRKAAETELRDANETLLRQQQALVQSEKMAAMGKMAAGVAHEIANPLSSMDSLLQLALRRAAARGKPQEDPAGHRPEVEAQACGHHDVTADPATREIPTASIGLLREQIERIARIVRELTTFAHPDSAEWRIMPLCEIVREALRMVRFDRRLRGMRVACDCCEDAVGVRVVPQQMYQVIINLVMNALDAMENVEQPVLTIRTFSRDSWRVIEVTDNGHGIPPEQISRIFEPFFTTKPVGCGTGLGLSIAYSIIQRHGGRLDATSRPGEGTSFSISLPAATGPQPAADSVASPAAENHTGD